MLAKPAYSLQQRTTIDELDAKTREAAGLYSAGKFAESAAMIVEVQTRLTELMPLNDAKQDRQTRLIYRRLARAHGLLQLEGAEFDALPSWDDLAKGKPAAEEMAAGGPNEGGVSFKTDIAPWLISSCGNCHINNRRGQFSMASYNDLVKGPPEGTVIFAGSESGNRLVEVIESGDMPRGGGKVSSEQLNSLKKWIAEGAKFDGPEPAAALASFASAATAVSATPATAAMKMEPATGAETVSFARDIAPILRENCNGCHIAGRQASGGLRMDSFAQLLRGGDSGPIITQGNPEDSLLVKKLKGQAGQRMPAGGRPPLGDDKIQLISTWIRENARFDGPDAATNIDVVISQAWADAASHEELFQRRKERALASWKRVLPNDEPAQAASDEFLVVGNVPQRRIEEILKQFTSAAGLARKDLDAPVNEPLVKGGLAVFVLKSRYDYSEFGRMTENRELPKEWLGHWKADPLDVYCVVSGGSDLDADQSQSLALQVIAGAYLGSFDGAPTWFAEGVARNLVMSNFRRDDPRVKQWQSSIGQAGQKIDSAKTLIEGRLDEEAAGVVGMAITNFMMERGNRRRFIKLLELLRSGQSFNEAMTETYAKPDDFIKAWLGKK
jgi:mono/diheme cytochrome c family protein